MPFEVRNSLRNPDKNGSSSWSDFLAASRFLLLSCWDAIDQDSDGHSVSSNRSHCRNTCITQCIDDLSYAQSAGSHGEEREEWPDQ